MCDFCTDSRFSAGKSTKSASSKSGFRPEVVAEVSGQEDRKKAVSQSATQELHRRSLTEEEEMKTNGHSLIKPISTAICR